jgi:uncharacterized repeat protein (TIGR01451 family)
MSVFKVDTLGVLTRVAGNGEYGFSGDGGPALSAQLSFPNGVAVDSHDNLYIADSNNNRVRMVNANGIITTVAGAGPPGYSGDNGPARNAQLSYPNSVSLDRSGNLYITDASNSRIRRVAANGTITTVAGNGTSGYSGDNGPAIHAELNIPLGTAVDSSGNLYIADAGNLRIRKVSTAGIITTVAGNGTCCNSGDNEPAISAQMNGPVGVALDQAGNLYIAVYNDNNVRKVGTNGIITTAAGNGVSGFSGDGGSAPAAQLNFPQGVVVDSSGSLYIADTYNGRVRKVSTSGIISTAGGGGMGDGGTGAFAALLWPTKIAVDKQGNLYVSDTYGHRVRRIAPNGTISTVAGTGTSGYSGDNGPAAAAQLNNPQGVAVDSSGNLYISDSYNHRIRMVNQSGTITTVAGNGLCCSSGDNGPATGAELNIADGVTVDASGNLYIAETGGQRIRKVDTEGIITTVAGTGTSGYSGDNGPAIDAQLFEPWDVTIDSIGNLYIADAANNRVRKVTPTGVITTVAGTGTGSSGDNGPAIAAGLTDPRGVAVDAAGDLYIAGADNRIRKILPNGMILTIAGSGLYDYSGDGGPAASATFRRPVGLALDSLGNVYVGDAFNGAVRRLTVVGTQPVLTINGTHSSSFTMGQQGIYTLTVSNAVSAGTTSGTVTVAERLPSGLTLADMFGPGWNCSKNVCSRSDSLGAGSSYPPITVKVNVGTGIPMQLTNQASVSGGGSVTNGASDLTLIAPPSPIAAVVNGASFAPNPSPGSLATITGTDLSAATNSATGAPLPLSLSGVCISVNGIPANMVRERPTD